MFKALGKIKAFYYIMAKQLDNQATSSLPLELVRGITYSRQFQWTDNKGVAIDLTLKQVAVGVKSTFATNLYLISSGPPTALGSKIEITDAVNGKFKLLITDEETSAITDTQMDMANADGRWWLELHDGGDIHLLIRDCVSVEDI